MNETTLYFITKNHHVKRLNRDVKDMLYKYVKKNIYQVSLEGKWYDVDRETWNYIAEWTSWH